MHYFQKHRGYQKVSLFSRGYIPSGTRRQRVPEEASDDTDTTTKNTKTILFLNCVICFKKIITMTFKIFILCKKIKNLHFRIRDGILAGV